MQVGFSANFALEDYNALVQASVNSMQEQLPAAAAANLPIWVALLLVSV